MAKEKDEESSQLPSFVIVGWLGCRCGRAVVEVGESSTNDNVKREVLEAVVAYFDRERRLCV
jgi:hypothetical protein